MKNENKQQRIKVHKIVELDKFNNMKDKIENKNKVASIN